MRKQISLSFQDAELKLLDELAHRLGLSRSACIRVLVTRYYKDELTDQLWQELKEREAATNGRKVE